MTGASAGTAFQPLRPAAELAGRMLLAALFIAEAASKLGNVGGAIAYMAAFGLWAPLLAPAIALELVGGFLLVLGWQTRLAALGLSGFCVSTAFIFHRDLANQGQMIHFEKDLALAGAFLALWANGAGRLSLDAWRSRRGSAARREPARS